MIYVEVVENKEDTVVSRMGPFGSDRMADKCRNGVDINLNHAEYYAQTHESDEELPLI